MQLVRSQVDPVSYKFPSRGFERSKISKNWKLFFRENLNDMENLQKKHCQVSQVHIILSFVVVTWNRNKEKCVFLSI